jgi:hypothetical protein
VAELPPEKAPSSWGELAALSSSSSCGWEPELPWLEVAGSSLGAVTLELLE